jgi:(p)ppGpp synthase/HD superfamily hydrolase
MNLPEGNTMKKGEMLGKMIKLMVDAHDGQFDRGGQPYCCHPLKVMHYLKTTDEELMCIALGHDVVEDTDVTYQDLRAAGMTDRVINGIRALTKQPGQTYEEYKQGVFASRDAMLVKCADLRHNTDIRRLKGVTEKDIARMAKYHTFYLEIQSRLSGGANEQDE